ncbi:MAG: GNAT family N-acetyltransferase [Oscillospiraceae bacterium]
MIDYIAITAKELAAYNELLLPQVYARLQQQGDISETDSGTLLALGARCEDIPVGALVAILQPNGDIELLSLFVLPRYWRQGIATGLVDRLLRIASGCYVGARDDTANCIMLKANYLLTEGQLAALHPFLENVGFTSFVDDGYAYGIDSTALEQCHMLRQAFTDDAQPDAHVVLLASLTTKQRLELLEDGDDFLDDDSRDWSYGYRVGDNITDLLLAERGYGNSLVLRERGDLDGGDSRSLLAVLVAIIRTAHTKLGAFRLYVEGDEVLDTDTLQYLIKHGANRYCKQLAWGQVRFTNR